MFLAEIGIGVAVPMVLLAFDRFRQSPKRLAFAQGLVVLGFIFHRLNVSITSVEAATGHRYVPSFLEFLVSAGLVAVGMWVFVLACRYLPVFPEEPAATEGATENRGTSQASLPVSKPVTAFDRT
jgi:Ni/Fe-hydrogenase subunit HybB-like protein